MRPAPFLALVGALAATATTPAPAQQAFSSDAHPVLREAVLRPKPGARVPLDVPLVDQHGTPVSLGRYFDGQRPVLLVPGYYHCEMLCGLVLDGVAKAIAGSGLRPGVDYRIVAVSIDPRDTPETARLRRDTTVAAAIEDPGADTWPFLVGKPDDIARLMDAIGFGYAYDETTRQYAHPAVVVALTPDARVSGYLQGVGSSPRELDARVRGAADGDTGHSLTGALMRCFQYTPALRKWAGVIGGSLRGGGLLILLGAVALVAWTIRRGRRDGTGTEVAG